MPEQPQPRYVQMPDNSYVEWPEGVSAEEFKAKVAGKFGTPGEEPVGLTGLEHHDFNAPVGKEILKGIGNIGAGGLGALATLGRISPWGAAADALSHQPTIYEDVWKAATHPKETGAGLKKAFQDVAAHPLEHAEGLLGALAIPIGAEDSAAMIPSRARAINTLKSIEAQAADVPVTMENTIPALQKFGEHVATGGKGARAMKLLDTRIARGPKLTPLQQMQADLSGETAAGQAPVNFPEARDFYTNVSDVTRRPGFLRRAFEEPGYPRLRAAAGPVRKALHTDLTNAAEESIGRGEDYANAIREYARAERLRSALRKGAIIAAPAVAGAAGAKKLYDIGATAVGQ
jgi:hypothetical protein